jgi:hypothetical protein
MMPKLLVYGWVGTALLIGLAGCGAAGPSAAGPTTAVPAPATTIPAAATASMLATAAPAATGQAGAALPGCAKAETSIPRPAEFPAAFPLPPGTVITAQEARSDNRIIITTVVPMLDVKGVAQFFERELPKAGFQTAAGESEPGEAEANYEGNGYTGRWKVNEIAGCAGAVTLQVLAGK